MKKINCLVQEQVFSKEEIRKLEAGLKQVYADNYSLEPVSIFWMIMPEGYAFSERKPSKATIIMVEVNDDIRQEKREELMHLFSKFLLQNFDISPLDSVITVANTSFVNAFFEAQRKRIRPLYQPLVLFKTVSTALKSKWKDGFLELKVRY